MYIKGKPVLDYGYNVITAMDGVHAEALMDNDILKLRAGERVTESQNLERAYLLTYGKIELRWDDSTQIIERPNCFDYSPWVLHVDKTVQVEIVALSDDCEICISRTDNETTFPAKLYTPEECRSEMRGEGTMNETSTRIVRTVFDRSNAPYANLVIGEVIGFPGRWSSYPPHHHPQPEVYYYKLCPPYGYAHGECGDDVYKLYENDAVLIQEGEVHSQAAAPGYALWYLWVIRHLDNNPYITPTFVEEHKWVQDKEAKFWPEKTYDKW